MTSLDQRSLIESKVFLLNFRLCRPLERLEFILLVGVHAAKINRRFDLLGSRRRIRRR
jgi:hypothetical protein